MGGEPRDRAARRAAWERERAAAVAALQQAEDTYQRVVAGSAFLSAAEDPSAVEVQHDALNRLEEARRRLDEVQQARPPE